MLELTEVAMDGLLAVAKRPFISKYVEPDEEAAMASRLVSLLRGLSHDHAPRSSVVNRLANWMFQLTEGRHGDARTYQNLANNLLEGLVQEGLLSKVLKPYVNPETGEYYEIKSLICHVPVLRTGVTVYGDIPVTRSIISGRKDSCLRAAASVSGVDLMQAVNTMEKHAYVIDPDLLPDMTMALAALPETKRPHVERTLEDARAVDPDVYRFGVFLDWRNRMYTETGGTLSYQNCRFSRSMINYKETRYVDDAALEHYRLWVDREFGLAKKDESPRQLMVEDPRSGVMAAAAFKELASLEAGNRDSRAMMYPDGSCSGMQMAALMLRSTALAKATNLIGTEKSDLYMMMAEEANVPDKYRVRAFAKPIGTVINYGGGANKCMLHTRALVPAFAALPEADQEMIASEYHDAFFRLFPECRWLINTSRGGIKQEMANDRFWAFVNPMGTRCWSGKLINQDAPPEEIGHSRYGTNCHVLPMEVDHGMAGALANMTHSVDATVAAHVVAQGGSTRPVSPIHDAFGVHIANGQWVTQAYLKALREAYRWLPTWFRMNGMAVSHGNLNEADITNPWALA